MQRFGLVIRSVLVLLLGASAIVACEAIAGYSGLKPWPAETGASTDAAPGPSSDATGMMSSGGTGPNPTSTSYGSVCLLEC
jgi:hypothetical protein